MRANAMRSTNWMELRLRTMPPMEFEKLCTSLMETTDEYRGIYRIPLGHGERDQGIDARVDHPRGDEMRVWFCFSTQRNWWTKCRKDLRKYNDDMMKYVQEVVFCFNADADKHEVEERRKDAESLVCELAKHNRIKVRIFTMRELLELLTRKQAQQVVEKWTFGFRTASRIIVWEPMERLRSSIELLDEFHIGPRRNIANEVYQIHLGLWGLLDDVAHECQRRDLGPVGDQRLGVLLNNLACLCLSQGERESAYEHLMLALDLLAPGPEQACVLSNLVKICSEMEGCRIESVRFFQRLHGLFGSSEELQLPPGIPLLQLGWATEIGDPSQGTWTPSDRVVVPFRYAGYANLYVGNDQEARALFERSVAWQGRKKCSPDSLVGLAYIHRFYQEDKLCEQLVEEAMNRLFAEAITGREGERLQYEACAETYARRYDRALSCIEKLKQVEPERLHYICDEPHYEPLRRQYRQEFQEVVGQQHLQKV